MGHVSVDETFATLLESIREIGFGRELIQTCSGLAFDVELSGFPVWPGCALGKPNEAVPCWQWGTDKGQ